MISSVIQIVYTVKHRNYGPKKSDLNFKKEEILTKNMLSLYWSGLYMRFDYNKHSMLCTWIANILCLILVPSVHVFVHFPLIFSDNMQPFCEDQGKELYCVNFVYKNTDICVYMEQPRYYEIGCFKQSCLKYS